MRDRGWVTRGKQVMSKSGTVILGFGLLVGLGMGLAWWAGFFGQKIEPAEKPVAVDSVEAMTGYRPDRVHEVTKGYVEVAIGTLKAANRTEISSRVLATIETIHVKANDPVAEGAVLVELDQAAMKTQILQAQAALDAEKSAMGKAQDDNNRLNNLRQSMPRAVTDQQWKQSIFNLQSAKANTQRSEQALAEALVMLSYTEIRAPKPGTILERFAEEGDVARPGVPLLSLYDPTSLRLEVPVMENLAVKLKRGDVLNVDIDALDRRFEATVDEIIRRAEESSRSFLVKVKLPPSPDLYEGMTGRLEIPAGRRRHLCLATEAIETVGQLDFVRAVSPDGKTWERRFIKVGRLGSPERIEVLSGLRDGDLVLVPEAVEEGPR